MKDHASEAQIAQLRDEVAVLDAELLGSAPNAERDDLEKKRRRLLLYAEGESYKATTQLLKNLSDSNSASLEDLELLAGGYNNAVLKRVSRRLWTGRTDSLQNYDMSEDQEFISYALLTKSSIGGLSTIKSHALTRPHTPSHAQKSCLPRLVCALLLRSYMHVLAQGFLLVSCLFVLSPTWARFVP